MNWKAIITMALLGACSLTCCPKSVEAGEQQPTRLVSLLSKSNWPVFSSELGLFSIQMPGQPEEQTRETQILGHPSNWTLFQLQQDSDVYTVAYIDLTEEDLERGAKDTLESLKNSVLNSLNLQQLPLRGRRISLDGYAGREFLGIQSGKVAAVRLYLIGQRLYGLATTSDTTANISQFLNSFEVEPLWESVTSDLGQFEIRLPTTPTTETEQLNLDSEQLTWNFIRAEDLSSVDTSAEDLAQSETENLYAVGYADLPTEWSRQDTENVLGRVSPTLLKRLNLQLLSDSGREIVLNGNPGREFLGIRDGRIFALRLYRVEERVYGLFTVSDEVTDVERFFSSFELLSERKASRLD